MQKLADHQQAFLKTVLDKSDFPEKMRHDIAEGCNHGLNIYRNNTYILLTEQLMALYPAVVKLVDERFFCYAADCFIQTEPPHSGDMNDYGVNFPDFLAHFTPLQQHPYVADVARLDYARHDSFLSPILPAVTAENIAQSAPETALFYQQPHLCLTKTTFQVFDIWRAVSDNQEITGKTEKSAEYIITYRQGDDVVTQKTDAAGYKFLLNLPDIAQATENALQQDATFDAGQFLGFCLKEKLLCFTQPDV